jgi:hypothetical protein
MNRMDISAIGTDWHLVGVNAHVPALLKTFSYINTYSNIAQCSGSYIALNLAEWYVACDPE